MRNTSAPGNPASQRQGLNLAVFGRVKPAAGVEQSLFSGSEEGCKAIVTSQVPIRSRIINSQFKTDKDLERSPEIFEDKIDTFVLDEVFTQKTSQEIFYRKTLKEAVQKVGQGSSASLLLYGPSRCGKTYAFAGGEKHEKGVIFRSAEELLERVETAREQGIPQRLVAAMFLIYNNSVVDLQSQDNTEKDSQSSLQNEINVFDIELKKRSDIRNWYVNGLKRLSELIEILAEKKLYEQSDLVVRYSVFEGDYNKQSLTLVRLHDSDSQHLSFNDLSAYLSQKENSKLSQSILVAALQPSAQSYTGFVCCLSAAPQQYPQCLLALDFTSQLTKKQLISQLPKSNSQSNNNNSNSNSNSKSLSNSGSQSRILKPPVSPSSQKSSNSYLPLDKGVVSQQIRPLSSQSAPSQTPARGSNEAIEFIVNETESVCNDIRQQQRLLARISSQERAAWISQKQNTLEKLKTQLDQQPYSRDVPYCETLLQKCQRQLRLISPIRNNEITNNNSRNVSPSPPPSSGIGKYTQQWQQLQENESHNKRDRNNHSNHNSRPKTPQKQYNLFQRDDSAEALREKEEQLDNGFFRLVDKCNHSRELVDSLQTTHTRQFQQLQQPYEDFDQQQQQQQRYLLSSSQKFSQSQQKQLELSQSRNGFNHKNLNNSSTLSSKIQRDLEDRNNSSDEEYSEKIGSRSNGNHSFLGKSQQIDGTTRNVDKSLQALKETIQMKEQIEKNKASKLRAINSDLKGTLKEYIQKCEQLSEVLGDRDNELERMEYELRQASDDILLNMDTIKEYKVKEQGWMQMEEELRDANIQLKSKLIKKKKKQAQVREQCKRKEEELEEKLRSYEQKHQQFQKVIQETEETKSQVLGRSQSMGETVTELKQQVAALENDLKQAATTIEEITNFNQELNAKCQQESNEKIELANQNQGLASRQQQLEEQLKVQEQKVSKHKQRNEEEKKQADTLKDTELQKKKQKITSLKQALSESERARIELESKCSVLNKAREDVEDRIRELDQEIGEIRTVKESTDREITKIDEERNGLLIECEKMQNLIGQLEEKVDKLETSQLADAKSISELSQEKDRAESELQESQEICANLREQLARTKAQNEATLSDFEEKLEQVIAELTQGRQEIAEHKYREIEHKKALASVEEQAEKYKEKYLKAKHNNKNMQAHYKQLEDSLHQFAVERQIEQENEAKEKERLSRSGFIHKNKLRIIEEIQDLVRSHKMQMSQSFQR